MPWFRAVQLGEDDARIEKKNPLWKVVLTFGLVYSRWEPYTTVRSALNAVDWEIIESLDKLRRKLSHRKELAEIIEREVADVKRYSHDKFGVSEEFELTLKEVKERLKPYADRPDLQMITSFLNPVVIREYSLSRKPASGPSNAGRKAGPQNHGPVTPGAPGAATAYTLPEYANRHSIHIAEQSGVDQVVAFREENKGGNNQGGDRKTRMKQLRQSNPKFPEESDNEWNNRLQTMMAD